MQNNHQWVKNFPIGGFAPVLLISLTQTEKDQALLPPWVWLMIVLAVILVAGWLLVGQVKESEKSRSAYLASRHVDEKATLAVKRAPGEVPTAPLEAADNEATPLIAGTTIAVAPNAEALAPATDDVYIVCLSR